MVHKHYNDPILQLIKRCIVGSFSIWHWLIVLLVVLAVFGTSKLRNIGGDLGTALKGFKDAMKDDEKKEGETKVETVEHKAETTEKPKDQDNA